MATQSAYDNCTGFLGENPTAWSFIDPFYWQADTEGVYYFACGVSNGEHCRTGGMKAKITVAASCDIIKVTLVMAEQVLSKSYGIFQPY